VAERSLGAETARRLLAIAREFEALAEFTHTALEASARDFAGKEGLGLGKIAQPIRLAVTGSRFPLDAGALGREVAERSGLPRARSRIERGTADPLLEPVAPCPPSRPGSAQSALPAMLAFALKIPNGDKLSTRAILPVGPSPCAARWVRRSRANGPHRAPFGTVYGLVDEFQTFTKSRLGPLGPRGRRHRCRCAALVGEWL
jgi:hypothetical protein